MERANKEKVRKENKINKTNKDKRRKIDRSEKKSEKRLDDTELEDSEDVLDDEDIIDRRRKSKKKFKRKKKLIIIAAVIIIALVLIIGLWGMHSGKSYPSVSEIVNNKEKHLDKYIEVKGTVKTNSLDTVNKTFNLTDGKNDLLINYTESLPSGFEEGKDVVIKGTLRDKAGLGLTVEVKEIVVGCASKY